MVVETAGEIVRQGHSLERLTRRPLLAVRAALVVVDDEGIVHEGVHERGAAGATGHPRWVCPADDGVAFPRLPADDGEGAGVRVPDPLPEVGVDGSGVVGGSQLL
eukprot:gene7568-biopygen7968